MTERTAAVIAATASAADIAWDDIPTFCFTGNRLSRILKFSGMRNLWSPQTEFPDTARIRGRNLQEIAT